MWTCRKDKCWAIVPKVCYPFLSFAQSTLGEEDGRERVEDPFGLKVSEDSPTSEVSHSRIEMINRHKGLNSVAFTPTPRGICSSLGEMGLADKVQERGDQALLEQPGWPGGTQGHPRWHLPKREQTNRSLNIHRAQDSVAFR